MLKPIQIPSMFMVLAITALPVEAATLHVPKDHKTIQGAIDAARAGDVVLVETGTYREQVRLKERVTLRSAGDDTVGKIGLKRAEAVILEGAGAAAKEPAVVLANGAVLDGFTVTKVGAFDQKEYDKHYATQGENLPDERGAVGVDRNFPAVGVADVTAVVKNCLVHDNGNVGIGCTGKKNASLLLKNVVYRNMGGGIGVADGATPTVEGNKCFNNLRAGIGNRSSAGILLRNECYDNVRAGIGIREGAKPIVRNNKCYKNRRAGIGARMEGTEPLIEDNDCYQNAMAGIGCRDGARPLIRGNRCYENTLAGIGSRDGARPVITGNKCYRNKEAGIGTQLGAKALIAHNECYENERSGIGQRSDAETILDSNHVHHNKMSGIGFDECKAGSATVLHNKVIDNELVAIGIQSGWKVRLSDNELSRKDGLPPIVMVFKGAEAEFCANIIRGSGVAGIRTEGSVRVVNNRFECPSLRKGAGPPQFAVWGLPGANIVFLENKVSGWRHALFAEKSSVLASYNQVSDFWQVGIRVNEPATPVTAIGNRFWSDLGHEGVAIKGDQGVVEDNQVEKGKPDAPKKKEESNRSSPDSGPSKNAVLPVSDDSGSIDSVACDTETKQAQVSALTEERRFVGHTNMVWGVAFSADGKRCVSGGVDRTVRLWEVASGKELHCFQGHTSYVQSVALSPDGRRVLSGSHDQTLRLWDTESGKELSRFEGHVGPITSVAFFADGRRVLSASRDRTLRLWDVETGKEQRRFEAKPSGAGPLFAAAVTPKGDQVAASGFDKVVRFWDSAGKEGRRFHEHGGEVYSLAFSADGRYLVSGGFDRTIRLWDVTAGKEIRRFDGHTGIVYSVAISSDGSRLLSGGQDGTVRLWDVETGKELGRCRHGKWVNAVAFSPDGGFALSASEEDNVRLWKVSK